MLSKETIETMKKLEDHKLGISDEDYNALMAALEEISKEFEDPKKDLSIR